MSFLFGKKKGGPQPNAAVARDVRPPGPPGGLSNAAPATNGVRDQEKTALATQRPAGPNNHNGPVGGGTSVSPEHGPRGGSQQDNHVRVPAQYSDAQIA